MRIQETELYHFDELSEDAQQKAIDNNRNWNTEGLDWWDAVYDDAKQIAEILGIEIDNIYFSGFSSQGDGACFVGRYRYTPQCRQKIREYAPQDTNLHKIADGLASLQRKWFYRLEATVTHQGHYSHEYCTNIDVTERDESVNATRPLPEDELSELLRDFMQWIYASLEREYEYLESDEVVAESLIVNECEFTKDGENA